MFFLCLLASLSSAVVLLLAIAQPMRHFAADPGAESLLPPNCTNVHFMVHIPRSSFVREPLAPTLISLTPSQTNKNKSNTHLLYLLAAAVFPLSNFQLRQTCFHLVVTFFCLTLIHNYILPLTSFPALCVLLKMYRIFLQLHCEHVCPVVFCTKSLQSSSLLWCFL